MNASVLSSLTAPSEVMGWELTSLGQSPLGQLIFGHLCSSMTAQDFSWATELSFQKSNWKQARPLEVQAWNMIALPLHSVRQRKSQPRLEGVGGNLKTKQKETESDS